MRNAFTRHRDPGYLDVARLSQDLEGHLVRPFSIIPPSRSRQLIAVSHPGHGICVVLVDQRIAIFDDETGHLYGATEKIRVGDEARDAVARFRASYGPGAEVVAFVWGRSYIEGVDLPNVHAGEDAAATARKVMAYLERKGRLHS